MPILDRSNEKALIKYENFVQTSPYANLTQDIRWSKVKSNWENEQVYLEENGEIIAALSILFMKTIGSYTLAYAPRGPVCDPYNVELVKKLVKEAEPVLKKHNAFVLRFDPEIAFDENLCKKYEKAGFGARNRQYGKHDLIQPRFNMFLNIQDKTFEELMPSFSEKTRYNIRLSQKKGVEALYTREDWALDVFYNLYKTTCERDKIGARPKEYFIRMRDAYNGDMLRIYLTKHEEEYLSAAIAINYGRKVFYIYGASGNEKRNLMPNHTMQSAMIQWALENKKSLYDFGGVFILDKSNGLYRFKEGFCHETGATELIGEFDWVLKELPYWAYNKALPKVQAIRKKLIIDKKISH